MVDIAEIEKAVGGVLAQEAVELVDLKFVSDGGRWVMRFFVDKEGGVTLSDCERVSKRIGAILDVTDIVPGRYSLEVSSPGMNRLVKKEKDFKRFSGERIKLRVKCAVNGQSRFRGTLKGFEDGEVLLESEGTVVRFPLGTIAEARLDPEIRI